MANTNTKRATKAEETVENVESVETVDTVADVNDNAKEAEQPKVEAKKVVESKVEEEVKKVEEPLNDYDIIKIEAIIPNVSYKDPHTDDITTWENVGSIEELDFATVKNMWKFHKNYFRHMLLRPLDDRVIKKFGLEKNYAEHDYLMDPKNYTRENIDKILDGISSTPNGMKIAVINKIKSMVYSGQLSDVNIIKKLDVRFGLDLISMV